MECGTGSSPKSTGQQGMLTARGSRKAEEIQGSQTSLRAEWILGTRGLMEQRCWSGISEGVPPPALQVPGIFSLIPLP
jgi:hypothetical protein